MDARRHPARCGTLKQAQPPTRKFSTGIARHDRASWRAALRSTRGTAIGLLPAFSPCSEQTTLIGRSKPAECRCSPCRPGLALRVEVRWMRTTSDRPLRSTRPGRHDAGDASVRPRRRLVSWPSTRDMGVVPGHRAAKWHRVARMTGDEVLQLFTDCSKRGGGAMTTTGPLNYITTAKRLAALRSVKVGATVSLGRTCGSRQRETPPSAPS